MKNPRAASASASHATYPGAFVLGSAFALPVGAILTNPFYDQNHVRRSQPVLVISEATREDWIEAVRAATNAEPDELPSAGASFYWVVTD